LRREANTRGNAGVPPSARGEGFRQAVEPGLPFHRYGRGFTLRLRNSILEIQSLRADAVDVRVEMTRQQFNKLFEGGLSSEPIAGAQLTGDKATITDLFAVLDNPAELPVPNISLR
jgi:alkyl sulfatase BDS1-like metallo-beta-lactamase superfamily hydrolase